MSTSPIATCLGIPIPYDFSVDYPISESIQECFLERILNPNPYRPLGGFLLADPDNGKTFLFRNLQNRIIEINHNPNNLETLAALYIQSPTGANSRFLFQSIAKQVRIPLPERGGVDTFVHRVLRGLSDSKTRVILVDETQHLVGGTVKQQRQVMDHLKTFSNELGIPIITSGTTTAFHVIQSDDQYSSRMPLQFLPRWGFDKTFLGLVKRLELEMRVEPGTFTSPEPARLISILSKGVIGSVTRLMNGSLKEANRVGASSISVDHIKQVGLSEQSSIEEALGASQ